MATTNEKLVDAAIRRAVYVHQFGQGIVRSVLGYLDDEVLPDLLARLKWRLDRIKLRGFDPGPWTTAKYLDLVADAKALLERGTKAAEKRTATAMRTLAKAEAVDTARQLTKATPRPLGIVYKTIDLRAIQDVVATPAAGATLGDWWKRLGATTQDRVKRAVSLGLGNGLAPQEIVDLVEPGLDLTRSNASAIVQTFTTHVSTQARERTFAANADVIKGVQWITALDVKVCHLCAPNADVVFAIGEGPRPPLHPNDRCTMVAVTKSFRELGLDRDELPEGTRAAQDGQTTSRSREEWLARQPAAIRAAAEKLAKR